MIHAESQEDAPLHRAIQSGDLGRVYELLADGANPNVESYDGAVPLAMCARMGSIIEIAQALLDAGADPDGLIGWSSPLVDAAIHDRPELVKMLIAAGADVNQPDADGETALMWAIVKGNTDLSLYLLSVGADPRIRSRRGAVAREFAENQRNTEVLNAIDDVLAAHTRNSIREDRQGDETRGRES